MGSKRPVGKRINVWVPGEQLKEAEQIENVSRFFQICLDNAGDIMTWAILRSIEPQKYHPLHEFDDVIDDFNKKYPLDPLTAKRLGKNKWPTPSQKLPDVLS